VTGRSGTSEPVLDHGDLFGCQGLGRAGLRVGAGDHDGAAEVVGGAEGSGEFGGDGVDRAACGYPVLVDPEVQAAGEAEWLNGLRGYVLANGGEEAAVEAALGQLEVG
jgi:hypothetical protein